MSLIGTSAVITPITGRDTVAADLGTVYTVSNPTPGTGLLGHAVSTTLTETKGEFTLTKNVDIEPILKSNYEAKKDDQNGYSKDRSFRKVASIPFETWINLTKRMPELILGDKELREKTLSKWLRSEEGKMFWSVEKGV